MLSAAEASLPLRMDKTHYRYSLRKNHCVQADSSIKCSFNKAATFLKIQAHQHILVAETVKLYFLYADKTELYVALLNELIVPFFINLFRHFECRYDEGNQRPIAGIRFKGHFCNFGIMKSWPVAEVFNDDCGVDYFSNSRVLII